MFIIPDYVTLGFIALGIILLAAERIVSRFGKCSKKEQIVGTIHEIRDMFAELSLKLECLDKKKSSEEENTQTL